MIVASRRRVVVLYVLVAALLLVLVGRVWYIQVMSGTAYTKLAANNQTRSVIIPSVRGQILDDVGRPLVRNRTSLVVSVQPTVLAGFSDGGAAVLKRLARVLGVPPPRLREQTRMCTRNVPQPCWPGSPYQPIPVDQHVPDRVALQIIENQQDFPGVSAQVQPVVDYPAVGGVNAAQVLGYLQPITPQEMQNRHIPVTGFSGVDLVGQAGLEEQYDAQLRGSPGARVVSVNAAGDVTGTVSQTAAQPGNDLVTSLDARIQAGAEQALVAAIGKARAAGNDTNSGSAVVMTTTGRVIAMANYPTYNPGVWVGGISQREFNRLFGQAGGEPILDRATQGQYAPGSTWKVTSTAAAMSDGYDPNSSYSCPGAVDIAGRTFNNWTTASLGDMTLHQALVMSCDTVFYQLAYQMWLKDDPNGSPVSRPRDPMQKMALAWGFGRPTGVDLPEENPGVVPDRAWKLQYWQATRRYDCKYGTASGSYLQQIEAEDCRSGFVWLPGDAVNASIGQGDVLVTPLQLARAYAALANGGTLYRPRIGDALISPGGRVVQRITPPVTGHLPVPRATLAYIRSALADVTTQGTAAGSFAGFPLSKVFVAGKTGTAEVAGGQATSVYASFGPVGNPKYVVVVMIPKSGEGADVSAPAARQIWDQIYGLEGHAAAYPNGSRPSALPVIQSDGTISPPPGYRGGS
ncbi:MAG TPA: penicillin-binding protein 2 [Streptosporangiaceae bacterium]|nr:penicillin-binding protein 2 [Streptosporangiaceae bacterium]